jgi:dTDP-4-dehydrorhamnose 3,5-epimerase
VVSKATAGATVPGGRQPPGAVLAPVRRTHGFQTLTDNTEVLCQVSGLYAPVGEQGFRWQDPEFGIAWPLPATVISEQDANWPLLEPVGSAAS